MWVPSPRSSALPQPLGANKVRDRVPHENLPHDQADASAPRVGRKRYGRLLRWLAGAPLLLGVTLAHIHIVSQPASYRGPLLIADHLFAIALAVAILVVCASVGRFTLTRVRLEFQHPLETLLFSIVGGAAILSISILVCGFFSLLQTPIIALLLLLAGVVARSELAELPRLCSGSLAYLRRHRGHIALGVTGALVFWFVAAVLLVQAVAPPTDWDSLMYHLQIPQQFLDAGRILVPEDNLHIAFVGLVHMLYVPCLALQCPGAAAVLSVLFALLLGLATFSLAARFLNNETASFTLSTLWAATSILLVAITPRVDVALALYLLLAQYALLIALSDSGRTAHLYLAALLLGFAVGIKYHTLVYVLALAPLIAWVARTRSSTLTGALRPLTLFGLIFVAGAAPWLVKNWLLLEAPLYPFFSETLLEPWLASLYGSSTVPSTVDPEIFRALAEARFRFNLVDLFTAPGRLTVEQEGRYYHMNFLFLLLPLWVLYLRNRTVNWLLIPAVTYLLLLLLPFPLTNLRYLIPAFAPLTIVTAYIVVQLSHRLLSDGAARLLVISLAVLALYPSARAMQFWLRKSEVLGHFAGVTSEREYLDTGYSYYSQLTQAVNQRVPGDGKVLLLFEARGYYFEPAVIQDNMLTNWPLLAPKAIGSPDCLSSTGITHILVSDLAIRYYVRRGTDPQVLGSDLFPVFAQQCLAPFYQGPGFRILEVRARPEARTEPSPARG